MTHKSRMAHLRVANTERLRKPHARNWAGAACNEALGITPPSTSFLPEFFSGHFTILGDKGTGQRGIRASAKPETLATDEQVNNPAHGLRATVERVTTAGLLRLRKRNRAQRENWKRWHLGTQVLGVAG